MERQRKLGLAVITAVLAVLLAGSVSADVSIQNTYSSAQQTTTEYAPVQEWQSVNTEGYTLLTQHTSYDAYLKPQSNFGDGFRYCDTISGVEHCITYQPQDVSYRDANGAQDYLSALQSSSASQAGASVTYSSAFPNTDLRYTAEQTSIKEEFIINNAYRAPNTGGLQGGNITLDFGGYVKFPTASPYVDGVEQTTDFVTSEAIEFRTDSGDLLWTLPQPYAVDADGNTTVLQYEVDFRQNQIWFYTRTPYSWLANATYPVTVDPSVDDPYVPEQNMSVVTYQDNGFVFDSLLYRSESDGSYTPINNTWYNNTQNKFGATDTANNASENYTYIIRSSSPGEFEQRGGDWYFSTYRVNLDDICAENKTPTPNCTFSTNKYISSSTNLDVKELVVEFASGPEIDPSIQQVGDDEVLTFTTTESWTVPDGVTDIEYLIVAGGGGGGGDNYAGGGGAGGMLTGTTTVTAGETLTVTVGSGGSRGGTGAGSPGQDSSFNGITATGGGYGGCGGFCTNSGGNGGSGGGGGSEASGGSGIAGQGNNGAASVSFSQGGGGGGAGQGGSGQNGGDGLQSNITGTLTYYAGGGGGGVDGDGTSSGGIYSGQGSYGRGGPGSGASSGQGGGGAAGVVILRYTPVDCTVPQGSAWIFDISSGCPLNETRDLGADELIIRGASGTFAPTQPIYARSLRIEPDDFDGDFVVDMTNIITRPAPSIFSSTSAALSVQLDEVNTTDQLSAFRSYRADTLTSIQVLEDGSSVGTCTTSPCSLSGNFANVNVSWNSDNFTDFTVQAAPLSSGETSTSAGAHTIDVVVTDEFGQYTHTTNVDVTQLNSWTSTSLIQLQSEQGSLAATSFGNADVTTGDISTVDRVEIILDNGQSLYIDSSEGVTNQEITLGPSNDIFLEIIDDRSVTGNIEVVLDASITADTVFEPGDIFVDNNDARQFEAEVVASGGSGSK